MATFIHSGKRYLVGMLVLIISGPKLEIISMLDTKKILDRVIKLQTLHELGFKEATMLRSMLEGEVSTSPKALDKKRIGAIAVNKRNIKIKK